MKSGAEERKTDKLFNFRPAFFAAVFLILGVLFAYYKLLHGVSAWWLLLLLPVAITPFFFCRAKENAKKRLFALILLTFFFVAGYSAFRSQAYGFTRCGYYNGNCVVTGTVTRRVAYGASYKLVLDEVYVDGNKEEGLLNAYLPSSFAENLRIADIIVVEGYTSTQTEYFNGYGFRVNDISDGARFTLRSAESYAKAGRSNDLFLLIRDRVERVVYAGMDETSAAVTIAVLTGDTAGIESELLDNMRYGGIAHIFAVSGLHVGALYAFCLVLFSKTKLKNLPSALRFLLLTATLLFYAGICGFSASVIRATLLCLVGYFMKRLGSPADSLNVLGVAAILILLFNPVSLFEIGFQLSFMACIGIVLLSKRIGQGCDELYKAYRKRFPRRYTEEEKKVLAQGDTLPPSLLERAFRAVVSVLSTSLAAQITTAPLTYMAFGYLSGWSLLLNFIFVPFISAVFAVLLSLVAVACILPLWCSVYVLYLPAVVWNAALLLFETADFSSFALVGMQLSGASCVCYYGGVCFLTDKWNVTKTQHRTLASACFIAFGILLALLNF